MRKGTISGMITAMCGLAVAAGIFILPGAKVLAAGDVEINETNFPNGNFRNWLQSQSYGSDDVLTQSEISDIKSIDLYNKAIKDLKGIEFFTELEELDISCNYTLESPDLSKNTKLKNLKCYSCSKITSLDLLTNTKLEIVHCQNSGLTSLKVKGLSTLQELDCAENSLESLDLSGCSSLKILNCRENSLTSLTLTGCKVLEEMDCYKNKLSSLDLSTNNALTVLDIGNNQFSKIDVSKNISLERFNCSLNNLSSIDVGKNTALFDLTLSNNQLTGIDVSKNASLLNLYLYNNRLTNLDVSKNASLEILDCSKNQLPKLDVSKNTELSYLECSDNYLTELDLNNNTSLNSLYCNNNLLTKLDVELVNSIGSLYCVGNKISDLKVNPGLKYLHCSNNSLKALDVTRNKYLRELVCNGNQIDTVYLYKKNYDTIKRDSTSKLLYLTPDDWEFTGFTWTGSSSTGYKDPIANFKCINIDALNHTNSYRVKTFYEAYSRQATCTDDGLIIYNVVLYNYEALDNKEHEGEITATPKALGHDWGDWKVTKKATVNSAGEETRVCKRDPSHKETRAIPKLTPTDKPSKDPTSKPTAKPSGKPAAKPTAKPSGKPTSKPTAKPTTKPSDDKKTTPSTKAITVVCGQSIALDPQAAIGKGTYTWKSSDTKIATVDSKGKITGKMAGTVNITVTCGSKSLVQPVTVLYKDVTNTKDFWFAPTNYLTASGVVKGYDKQTKFKPANECTRAQMVTFIWRLAGEPSPKAKTCKFKDVKKSDYFYKACIWGNEKHIVEGYKDGTFGPQIICARRHAVTFLWRLAGQPKPSSSKNKFSDVKKSDYFYTATLWASEMKILAGYSDGTFRPNGNCLRRQMVTFLYKYDKFVNEKG